MLDPTAGQFGEDNPPLLFRYDSAEDPYAPGTEDPPRLCHDEIVERHNADWHNSPDHARSFSPLEPNTGLGGRGDFHASGSTASVRSMKVWLCTSSSETSRGETTPSSSISRCSPAASATNGKHPIGIGSITGDAASSAACECEDCISVF
jgi:hypothetical protein